MHTEHKIINANSTQLTNIPDNSISLVVTSPPYPMIEMWDQCFSQQRDTVKKYLEDLDFIVAFEEMHKILDLVWQEIDRVLIDHGIVCINIGDATRNCNGLFRLFPNHSRIISFFHKLNYATLPDIIWRKQTNSPTKFLGSGMLPPGAYVTYEHEYILIFRKGGKREFKTENEKMIRSNSAYFWEERNLWFSDVWDIKGASQTLSGNNSRKRSAAFPFELAYRLINMFSVKGDVVLDPFVGTGTVNLAAMASERNSIGVEIDMSLYEYIIEKLTSSAQALNNYIRNRVVSHLHFIEQQKKEGRKKFYENLNHGFEVKTRQERQIHIREIENIDHFKNLLRVDYREFNVFHQIKMFN